MIKEFKSYRRKVLVFPSADFNKLFAEQQELNFAKYLGVSKITKITVSENEVFVFYEDSADDYDTFNEISRHRMFSAAVRALDDFFCLEDTDSKYAESNEYTKAFELEFGFPVENLYKEQGDYYILEDMVNWFLWNQDDFSAENDQWQKAIDFALNKLREKGEK